MAERAREWNKRPFFFHSFGIDAVDLSNVFFGVRDQRMELARIRISLT
jgi:hypothetical protein